MKTGRPPAISLRTHLLLLVAAILPLGALTTSLILQLDAPGTGWVIAAAVLLVIASGAREATF